MLAAALTAQDIWTAIWQSCIHAAGFMFVMWMLVAITGGRR